MTRVVETTLLVLAGVLLAAATINDLHRQVGINHRLSADLATWRQYTGHDYHDLTVDQEILGAGSEREVVCGNASPGAPKAKPQICLAIWGPTVHGRRTAHGGWYLRANVEYDVFADRYGCFGPAGREKCPP